MEAWCLSLPPVAHLVLAVFHYAISLTWIILISGLIKVCAHAHLICLYVRCGIATAAVTVAIVVAAVVAQEIWNGNENAFAIALACNSKIRRCRKRAPRTEFCMSFLIWKIIFISIAALSKSNSSIAKLVRTAVLGRGVFKIQPDHTFLIESENTPFESVEFKFLRQQKKWMHFFISQSQSLSRYLIWSLRYRIFDYKRTTHRELNFSWKVKFPWRDINLSIQYLCLCFVLFCSRDDFGWR